MLLRGRGGNGQVGALVSNNVEVKHASSFWGDLVGPPLDAHPHIGVARFAIYLYLSKNRPRHVYDPADNLIYTPQPHPWPTPSLPRPPTHFVLPLRGKNKAEEREKSKEALKQLAVQKEQRRKAEEERRLKAEEDRRIAEEKRCRREAEEKERKRKVRGYKGIVQYGGAGGISFALVLDVHNATELSSQR